MREGWTHTTVKDLIQHSIGGVWGESPGESEVDVRVYRSTEFNNDGCLAHEGGVTRSVTKRQLASRRLRAGDILLEKSGGGPNQPVGRVVAVTSEVPEDSICANFVQLIRPDLSVVHPSFLAYFLWHWHQTGRTEAFQRRTTGIRNLQTKAYLAQRITIPDLNQQRRIVDLIASVDAPIDATWRLKASAQRLLNTIAEDLIYGDDSLPLARASEVAQEKGLIGGPFGSSLTRKDYVDEGVPVIRGTNMTGNGPWIGGQFEFVSTEKAEELSRNQAIPGDIIFTQRGTLGQVALVPVSPYETYVISQSQMRLRPNAETASAEYVYWAFRAPSMVRHVKSLNTGTANPHINLGIQGSIEIPLPGRDRQDEIVGTLNCVDAAVVGARQARVHLVGMRRSLLADLLSGDHEIPDSYDRFLADVS